MSSSNSWLLVVDYAIVPRSVEAQGELIHDQFGLAVDLDHLVLLECTSARVALLKRGAIWFEELGRGLSFDSLMSLPGLIFCFCPVSKLGAKSRLKANYQCH
jgi:hypothetical protein